MTPGDWCYSLDHEEPGRVIAVDRVWGEEVALVWPVRRDAVVGGHLRERSEDLASAGWWDLVLVDDALVKEATAKLNDPSKTPFPKAMLAVTKGRFVVVEYTLEFVKMLGPDRAQLRIRELSSDGDALHLGLVPASERVVNVAVDTDLGKETANSHLRGFKVMEIGRHLGEMRIRFTNEVTISESETHHFSGTRIDNNPTREVAAARVDQPIPDFFGRAAEETFLTRAPDSETPKPQQYHLFGEPL